MNPLRAETPDLMLGGFGHFAGVPSKSSGTRAKRMGRPAVGARRGIPWTAMGRSVNRREVWLTRLVSDWRSIVLVAGKGRLGVRSVAVLPGFGPLDKYDVRSSRGHRAVSYALWDDEDVPCPEPDRIAPLYVQAYLPVPAQEELVLIVVMPRELAVQPSESQDSVVYPGEFVLLEGSRKIGDFDRNVDSLRRGDAGGCSHGSSIDGQLALP